MPADFIVCRCGETLHVFQSARVSQGGCHSRQLCRSNAVGMSGAATDHCLCLLFLTAVPISDQVSGLKDWISLKNLQAWLPEKPRHLEDLTQDNYLGEWRNSPFKGCTSSHSLLLSHKQSGLGPLSLDRRPPIRSNLCPTASSTLLPTLASAEGGWSYRTRLVSPGTSS